VLCLAPYGGIGDTIIMTALIRAIAESRPGISVDVLTIRQNAPVLEGNPHVASLLLFERRRWRTLPRLARELRRRRYDVIVDRTVRPPSLTSLLLMQAAGAKHRITVGGRGNEFIYTHVVPLPAHRVYQVERLAALTAPFGVDAGPTDWRPGLYLTSAELHKAERTWGSDPEEDRQAGGARPGRRVLVNVSATHPARRWPEEQFVEALLHLRRRDPGSRVLVIGAPAESARVARIARASGTDPVNTRSIREALALVATADMVFTPDTSISHAASAFSRPSVVMILRRLQEFTPYRLLGRLVVHEGSTLASLPAHAVIQALDEVLDAFAPH
jgi:ADP-heptose:LPS heptosyltransferase